jgi:RNAse (barnase) inhibitor barstar
LDKAILSIDGNNFSTLEGFYEEISSKVTPDSSWAHNLDAFNEILRGDFGTPKDGFVLVWHNSNKSRVDLGYEETVRQLEKRLLKCHPLNIAGVKHELKKAKRCEGPTVFNWLTEIILIHCPGGTESEDGIELILK